MKLDIVTQNAFLEIIKDAAFNHQDLWYVKIHNEVVPIAGLTYFKLKVQLKQQ